MIRTLGRFTLQPDKNFPLDCETLEYLQTNIDMAAVIGNLAGDKTILQGCEPEQNGTRRKPGYVFLKTNDFPAGEVLYWEGGNVSAGMYVKAEAVGVEVQGYGFPQAYTARSLAAGIGSENYSWADFGGFKTPRELEAYDVAQDAAIAKLLPPPLGIVQMWAGKVVPAGYELCNGQEMKISDYPELYAALGTTFNNAVSATGTGYSTTAGYFRLPDLRGRFIAGYNVSDGDYDAYGKAGGEKKHTLSAAEMPQHAHLMRDYYFIEAFATGFGGSEYVGDGKKGAEGDSDNKYLWYIDHNTGLAGSGSPHENRPPYYVLAYIMRTK